MKQLYAQQKRRKDAIDAFDRISKCGGDFLMEQWIFASKSIEACDITKNSDAIVMHAIKGNAEKLKEFQMCCNMRENPDAMLNQTMAQAKSNDPWEKFFATYVFVFLVLTHGSSVQWFRFVASV